MFIKQRVEICSLLYRNSGFNKKPRGHSSYQFLEEETLLVKTRCNISNDAAIFIGFMQEA